MIYVVWAFGYVVAFESLRRLGLRDFGVVTRGGLVGIAVFSILTPAALLAAATLAITTDDAGSFWGKPVWTKGGRK